jgi:hypothetical protein
MERRERADAAEMNKARFAFMDGGSRRRWLRHSAITLAIALFSGGAAWQSLSAAAPPDPNGAYVVLNPLNGEVVAVGHGTTVVMNPKTGQIVQVSASNISTDTIVMNLETGHVVYESH